MEIVKEIQYQKKIQQKSIKLDKRDAKDLYDCKMQLSVLSSRLGNLQFDYEKQKMIILAEMEKIDRRVSQTMAMLRKKHKIIGNIGLDVENGKLLI